MTLRSLRTRLAVLAAFVLAVTAPAAGVAAPTAATASARAAVATDSVVTIYTKLGYQNSEAAGTGIVIKPSGLVLTNNHVIKGATTLRVTVVGTGRTYTGTVLGYSVSADVALLKLANASGLPTAAIGGAVKVGTGVTAYGNGRGAGVATPAAPGKVRAVGQSITASDGQGGGERLEGLIQTDVGLEPGDSGGPLVDANGRVVGMNTAASSGFRFNYGEQTSTQAFAIPIGRALGIVKQIQAGKSTATVHVGPTAMLGVSVRPPDFGGFGGYDASGALVASVLPSSPAAKAGISAGSVITAVGSKRIDSPDDLSAAMLRLAPKKSVAITWLDELGRSSRATVVLIAGPPQ
jgi:S1-C subfamily serine protease